MHVLHQRLLTRLWYILETQVTSSHFLSASGIRIESDAVLWWICLDTWSNFSQLVLYERWLQNKLTVVTPSPNLNINGFNTYFQNHNMGTESSHSKPDIKEPPRQASCFRWASANSSLNWIWWSHGGSETYVSFIIWSIQMEMQLVWLSKINPLLMMNIYHLERHWCF